ncbi:MAG TPA: hypothetical protein VGK11_03500, partial [Actinomycetota bacterium]
SVHDPPGGFRDLRADAVAGDQGHEVRHGRTLPDHPGGLGAVHLSEKGKEDCAETLRSRCGTPAT